MTNVTKGVKVRGLAAPYNVANCFGETLKPGCFTHFLQANAGKPLDMFYDHERPIGVWDKIYDSPEGLRCEGFITNLADADRIANAEDVREMSINFMGQPEDAEHRTHIADKRAAQWASEDAIKGFELLLGEARDQIVIDPAVTETDIKGLTEITLCERGAFPGTHFEIVKE